MMLKRNLLGWKVEEYWFDEAGYLASRVDIAALRTHAGIDRYHCRIPEKTLLVPLDPPEGEILGRFHARTRASIRQNERTLTVENAESMGTQDLFYRVYAAFAVERGLLLPKPEEEAELDILLARDLSGELVQAAAFLPAPGEGQGPGPLRSGGSRPLGETGKPRGGYQFFQIPVRRPGNPQPTVPAGGPPVHPDPAGPRARRRRVGPRLLPDHGMGRKNREIGIFPALTCRLPL